MQAEIITIGDELLIGQVVDTNSAWISEQLNLNGITVCRITSIHDDHDQIVQALADAESRAELVLLTGGLGPTKDDITKKALCAFFECGLVFDEAVWEQVSGFLARRNVPVIPNNRSQAMVPEKCTALPNTEGTAPGMWFEKGSTLFVSMPGVPWEMEGLMKKQVLPRLRKRGQADAIYHRNVLVYGIAESALSDRIEKWELALPPFIRLAYLPGLSMLRLRLSAYGNDQGKLREAVQQHIDALHKLIPEYIFGYDNDNLAGVTGKLLQVAGATVGVSESCTGGYLGHLFTSNPGSSAYFKGGIIAYSNDVKTEVLGVQRETLDAHGAVSGETALEMALGVKKNLRCDYAVATTGIAGPDGGSAEKPVGTVWIAVAGKYTQAAEQYRFAHDREKNILRFALTAIHRLRQIIMAEK